MENQTQKLKVKYTQLGRYYLIALCSIALVIILSQVLVQRFISEQKSDSHLINLSGRQRMLSQKISKCAVLLGSPAGEDIREEWLGELEEALEEWSASHIMLQGNGTLAVDSGQPSQAVAELFASIQKPQSQINTAAEVLVERLRKDIHLPYDSLAPEIQTISLQEGAFLRGMDSIVLQFEQEARDRVAHLQNIELFLMVICLGVILFEILFVFLPSARSIKTAIQKLSESGEKSKAMAMELGALYGSLEEAYQDLVEVDVVPEDFTVFAKCDHRGNVTYISEPFAELMAFGETPPDNLFDWLNGQGYDAEYLQKIEDMVSGGKSWNGDIKAVNEEGDFVWLKLNIVPTLSEKEDVESLMVIGSDETEKKEAEAISREINKERVEKKVKEQQFRSALILEGQEEERKRISRDMHDGVGQLLSALKFNLEGIHTVQSDVELEKLGASKDLLKNVIKEVRRISFNLTPSALSDYGIVPVLKKFSKEITKISDLQVSFENQTGFLSRLEPKVENNLYRIVQEAVNNAIKYARADEVKIILSHNSQFLHVQITDNGKGFDLEQLEEKDHFSASGHGIFNIKERTNFISGQFEISTGIGKGTTISIQVPLE
jgi:two-component system sensor histidine kinase DegS